LRSQFGDDCARGQLGLCGLELVQQSIARDALDQAEDFALATGAHDRVGFPIADANALLDDEPVFDRCRCGQG
jgi:hypothetical protein